MVNRKKIDFGFTPSEYQEKIFDFIQHGVGNAVIQATAGSGKTSSIVAAMKLIPKKQKCIFLAFNKSIATELGEKMKNLDNVSVRTSHSFGYLMLRRNVGSDIEIDEYKYRTFVKNNITELTTLSGMELTRRQVQEYIESITSLIDYARYNLTQTKEEVNKVANKYDIPVSFDECDVVLKCLEWGKNHIETIDYVDMLWLPVEMDMKPIGLQYDWVFGDESQDFSPLSYALIKKCFKRGTRSVFVGDPNQSIYAFSGADEEAFNKIKSQPNTKIFELPISYRCAKRIVKYANWFVPNMQAKENADEGEIIENCRTSVLKDGDMVLARAKAPLLKLYIKLLKKNVNCYIKGQDIGLNLIRILENIKGEELNPKMDKDGVFVKLYDKLFNERNKLMQKRGLDFNDATLSNPIMEMYDNINTLITLSSKVESKTELIDHIREIFKEEAKGVCLSTIHKAKGLEANNVYILCHSCMPSKNAKHDWEKLQEKNLQYVAYTRAKHRLGFISEKEVPPTGSMQEPMEIINDLIYIENKVCKVLGKAPTEKMENAEIARFNLKNKTEIDDLHKDDNVIVKSEENDKPQDDKGLLDELETLLK